MSRSIRTSLVAALLAAGAWPGAAPAQDHKLAFDEELIPRFNIPRTDSPPKIDGRIDPGEWKQAVRVSGVVWTSTRDFRDRPVSFWAAWDARHLYIAARSDILPGHRLYRQHRERYSQGTVHDDAYELGLFLHDRNKLPGQTSSFLKIVLNSLGAGEYMKLYPSIGQNLFNWRPDMEVANRVYEDGGRQWWDMELSADLEDLQMPVEHQAGDEVGLLLAADLKNPEWQWLDVPSASGHLQHEGFPRAVLTSGRPYVQVERLAGLHDGRVEFLSAVLNPTDRPVKVRAEAKVLHGEVGAGGGSAGRRGNPDSAETVVSKAETLTIPPRGSVRFDLSQVLPALDYPKADRQKQVAAKFSALDVRVTPADDAQARPIYTCNVSFTPSDKAYLKAVPRTTVFEAGMHYNPVRGLMYVSADTLDAQLPPGAKAAAMTYEVTRAGRTVTHGRVDRYVHYKYEDLVKLPELAAGEYAVALRLVDAGGKVLAARDDLRFEKKDEAKVFAKWWQNRIGDVEKVLAPFEPLTVGKGEGSATAITCTRRTYELDSLGLPMRIVSNGGPVLAAPARMVVKVGGVEHVVPTRPELKLTDRKDWRVRFEGAAEAAGLRLAVTGCMEQDGLVELTLTYQPAAGPVEIEQLRIDWPVREDGNAYLACMGAGNYCPRFIGKVPAGPGAVWDTLRHIGLMGSNLTVGSFMGNLWVGDERRGLLWAADSDRGWVVDNDVPAHVVVRDGPVLVIRNQIIGQAAGGKPFRLDAPRTVRFGYNASPFRRLLPGWRLRQISAANGFSGGKYKVNWDTGQDYFTVLSPPFEDTARWAEYYAHCSREAESRSERGLYDISPRLGPYLTNQIALRGYAPKSIEPGVYDYFGGDWGGDTLSASQRDYFIWLQNRQVREGGCTHFYYDISFTSAKFSNLAAGFGYRLPDGRVQPEGCDDNLRAWHQRAWALMQETGHYPGGISGHATNSISLQALPWADSILDSEYPMKDPIDVYPSERMIALSCPHSFGVNISHLGFMNPQWPALHDAGMGGGHGGVFWTDEFRHWGIDRPDVQFIPYWRNAGAVGELTDGVLVSLWRRPGSVVLGVLNYGPDPAGREQTRPVRMKLNLAALGVPAGLAGERIRIGQLLNNRAEERYIGHLKWYRDLPAQKGRDRDKPVPPIHPRLDAAAGVVDGFEVRYHDVRWIATHWDERPIDDAAWRTLLGGELRTEALDWGINAADCLAVEAAHVRPDSPAVRARAWRRPGTVLLRLENTSDKPARSVVALDLRALGVKVEPGELWKRFTQAYDLQHLSFGPWSPGVREGRWDDKALAQQVREAGAVAFDGWNDRLAVHLAPGQVRMLSIDTTGVAGSEGSGGK